MLSLGEDSESREDHASLRSSPWDALIGGLKRAEHSDRGASQAMHRSR